MSAGAGAGGLHLRLPATSANLGPGFDALGLAMSFYLTIDAIVSPDGEFAIEATGRDKELCGKLDGNLILETYRDSLRDGLRFERGRSAGWSSAFEPLWRPWLDWLRSDGRGLQAGRTS